jgi:hypothetical protein
LRPTAERGELTGYAAALDDLWVGVRPTLAALDRVAAEPELLEDADLDGLRYALHRAAELAHGLEPPPEAGCPHEELGEALAGAREATWIVADALEAGGLAAAKPLVWEWRGALFNVRLAYRRLAASERRIVHLVPALPQRTHRSTVATALVVVGAGLVLCGALAGLWALWTVGIVLVLGSLPISAPPA